MLRYQGLHNDEQIHQENKTKKPYTKYQVADIFAIISENTYSFSLSLLQRIFIHKAQTIHPSETICSQNGHKILHLYILS